MPESLNQRWAAHLVGALVASGVRHAVIAPGSRSTPLALALAERPDVRAWPVIDERSAAFFALGLSKSTGTPAVVVCTSGSAGAHFLPAVMEASEGATPLVVITADRPWELHGFGAPQTIAQAGLFGRYVRAAEDFAAPEEGEALLAHLVATTARQVAIATRAPRGPVHLNVPFREPLAPTGPGPVVTPRVPELVAVRGLPDLARVREAVAGARRGLILCGPRDRADAFGEAVHALGEALGFPVLAEAASNARFGFPGAVSLYDALLRQPAFAEAMRPDLVLRFGGGLTARGPQQWLDASGARLFAFSDDGLVFDPQHRAEQVLSGDAVAACQALAAVPPPRAPAGDYRRRWLAAQAAAQARLDSLTGTASEPLVARELARALPPGTPLVVSSSMPIRDLDAFAPASAGPVRVFTNRGVNGIDGVTSTALGVAAGAGKPTALLIGDVALLHDLHAWVAARQHGLSLTAVVVNNDGGGIFHFLPVAGSTPHFEALFGTPHGVDLAHVAGLAGATLHRPADLGAFSRTVAACLEGGLHLVEVRTERAANVAEHRRLFQALGEALP